MEYKVRDVSDTLTCSIRAASTEVTRTYTYKPFFGSMYSENHPNHPFEGGPWNQESRTLDIQKHTVDTVWNGGRNSATGQVALSATQNVVSLPTLPNLSDKEVRAYGTTAIARTEPTQSEYSLATMLGEFATGGLPSAIGSSLFRERAKESRARYAASKGGSEYLNAEFGWLPLMRDVEAFLDGVRKTDQIISQYKRDSGRIVRRRMVMERHTDYGNSGIIPLNVVPNPRGWFSGSGFITRKREREIWFSGAYQYYVPDQDSFSKLSEYALIARRVHGLELTPEVVWNLAPWSWALDWFGNVGDVMHNASAIGRDGLVVKYGYIMSRTVDTTRILGTIKGPNGFTAPSVTKVTKKNQVRHESGPYGFDVDWSMLSAKQLAIVTALGFSKR